MVDKRTRLAVTKGLRYFAVENFGNCYGAKDYSSRGEPTAFECNFGVGLENFFFIYKVSTWCVVTQLLFIGNLKRA